MNNIVTILEFTIDPLKEEFSNIPSEGWRMVQWCYRHKMQLEVRNQQASFEKIYRVTFYRDENTKNFIKEFLETKANQALPVSSLYTIPGVRKIK